MKIILFSGLLFHQVIEQMACKKATPPGLPKPTNEQIEEVWDYYVHILKPKNRTHLPIPSDLKVKYGNWIIEYIKMKLNSTSPPPNFSLHHKDWQVENDEPEEGRHTPPWALLEGNGRPLYCYDEPEYGTCKENFTRWAYNSFTNKCDTFTYSGCRGNRNNFVRLKQCEKSCVLPPNSNCGDYVET